MNVSTAPNFAHCASSRFVRRNRLALHVFANPFDPRLATNTALLHATIGREMVDGVNTMRVDPDLSRLDFAGDGYSSFHVAAPDRTAQSVNGPIGPRDRIINVVVSGDWNCRT